MLMPIAVQTDSRRCSVNVFAENTRFTDASLSPTRFAMSL